MHETFTGIRVVKAFGMEKYEGRKFQEETRNLLLNVLKGIRTVAVFVPLMEFITVLGVVVAFWYGGYRIAHGELKPENFLSFFTALIMLYQPVKNLSTVNNTVQEGLTAAHRIYAILDAPGEVMEAPGAVGIMPISKSVEV
jgi:subfamily B ATP-binding cassette protein MsbA